MWKTSTFALNRAELAVPQGIEFCIFHYFVHMLAPKTGVDIFA